MLQPQAPVQREVDFHHLLSAQDAGLSTQSLLVNGLNLFTENGPIESNPRFRAGKGHLKWINSAARLGSERRNDRGRTEVIADIILDHQYRTAPRLFRTGGRGQI